MKSNMKKRILAFVLCMVMMMSGSGYALAETEEGSAEANTEVIQDGGEAVSLLSEENSDTQEAMTSQEVTPVQNEFAQEETLMKVSTQETSVSTPEIESASEPQEIPQSTKQQTTDPVEKKQESMELTQEIKDEKENALVTVTAEIQESTFDTDTSEVTMKVTPVDETLKKEIENLAKETLEENQELGEYFLYRVEFQVNGVTTEPGKEIKITFEPKDYRISDIKKANVFYYNEAGSPAGNEKAEIVEIIQKQELIEALQVSGQSIENIDENYDLTEIMLKEDGTADKIITEGRRSTVYGCYVIKDVPEDVVEESKEEKDPSSEKVDDGSGKENSDNTTEEITDTVKADNEEETNLLNFENEEVIITVKELEPGAIPEGAELSVIPILEDDKDTAEQYQEVKKQLDSNAESNNKEVQGFLAYDISIIGSDGSETEPDSEVKVTLKYKKAALPADQKAADLQDAEVSVLHLEEDGNGNVARVVDMNEAGQVDALETTSLQQVQTVELRTDSFSAYTITWVTENGESGSIPVSYVDENGESLDDLVGIHELEVNEGEQVVPDNSELKVDIPGYTFVGYEFSILYYSYDFVVIRMSNGTLQYFTGDYIEWQSCYSGVPNLYNLTMKYKKNQTGGSSQEDENIEHHKYIQDNNDGTYNLTMNVVGKTETIPTSPNLDVLLVYDISDSMESNEKWKKAQDAVKNLIDIVENKEGISVRWKLLPFSSSVGYKALSEGKCTWKNSDEMKILIDSFGITKYQGHTNYEQALTYAGYEIKNEVRSDATTAVIFITDGEPTVFGIPVDQNSWGSTEKKDYDAGLLGAQNVVCNRFYAVGIGLSETPINGSNGSVPYTGEEILQHVAAEVDATEKVVKNVAADQLNDLFQGIGESITNFLYNDVTMTDTLSEWAQVAGDEATLSITVKDGTGAILKTETGNIKDRVSLTLAATSNNKEAQLTASYDETTKKITLDFPDDYMLESDYTYSVTVQITPTVKAYEDYLSGSNTYPHIGDEETDAPGNYTSEDKPGFHSNTRAEVTYDYGARSVTKEYLHPVIQVGTPATEDSTFITVKKKFEGLDDPESSLPDFKMKLSSADKTTEIATLDYTNDDTELYKWTLDNEEAAAYSLKEENAEIPLAYSLLTTINGSVASSGEATVNINNPVLKMEAVEQKDGCDNQNYTLSSNPNFIAASLSPENQYMIWTKEKLSAGERAALKTFLSGYTALSGITGDQADVEFYSGDLTNGILIKGGTVKVANDSLSFTSKNGVWKNTVFGTYKVSEPEAEIVVENVYTKIIHYTLPSSGGPGIYWYLFGGVLLMMAASLMVYKNKRREVLER